MFLNRNEMKFVICGTFFSSRSNVCIGPIKLNEEFSVGFFSESKSNMFFAYLMNMVA